MDIASKWKIVRIILTAIYLFGGWILFTGNLALYSLCLGGIFSFTIAMMTYSIFIEETEAARRSLLPRIHYMLIYFLLIIVKIYTASFRVAYFVISGNINPRIVHFRTHLKYELARAILANSITLTPGTLTLDLDRDCYIVHWLNAKTTHSHYAGKLIKGDFEKWLARIWM